MQRQVRFFNEKGKKKRRVEKKREEEGRDRDGSGPSKEDGANQVVTKQLAVEWNGNGLKPKQLLRKQDTGHTCVTGIGVQAKDPFAACAFKISFHGFDPGSFLLGLDRNSVRECTGIRSFRRLVTISMFLFPSTPDRVMEKFSGNKLHRLIESIAIMVPGIVRFVWYCEALSRNETFNPLCTRV